MYKSEEKHTHVMQLLNQVPDPEIPVLTIGDLGIVKDVSIKDDKVTVFITPTYTGCPAMDMISVQIKATLMENGYPNCEVKLILHPVWSTDMISEKGMLKMKQYGIAPPAQKTSDQAFRDGKAPVVKCPLCGSEETEIISHFGSTPCKALYKCGNCLEPFDYFKCH